MRNTLLVLHILGAATWLGANVTQAVATPGFVRVGGVAASRWWKTTVRMGKVLYPPAATVVLISGILLVVTTGYEFSDAFVGVGIAMVIVGGVLGSTVFGPKGAKAAEMRATGDDAAALPLEATIRTFGLVDTLLLVLTVVAMVTRWGA